MSACDQCGNELQPPRQRFCSEQCSRRYHNHATTQRRRRHRELVKIINAAIEEIVDLDPYRHATQLEGWVVTTYLRDRYDVGWWEHALKHGVAE